MLPRFSKSFKGSVNELSLPNFNKLFSSSYNSSGFGISYNNINDINSQQQLINKREYRTTIKSESLVYYGIGAIGLSIVAHQLYKLSKELPQSKSNAISMGKATTSSAASSTTDKKANEGFFASFFARTFYDGGFEDKMTKREAALILGVRESATPERIKDAHRRILLLNHPDLGGSAFIAAKVNEAKALLLKGKT